MSQIGYIETGNSGFTTDSEPLLVEISMPAMPTPFLPWGAILFINGVRYEVIHTSYSSMLLQRKW